ncbi:MAG: hypothetical protein DRI36_05615 [Caldiserica bacterium]|nr:MAG: hypothetical protein DRI36_05615 [Caldisericota bacterium]
MVFWPIDRGLKITGGNNVSVEGGCLVVEKCGLVSMSILEERITYYFRLRARSSETEEDMWPLGIPSEFDLPVATVTLQKPPLSPTKFSGVALGNDKIMWSWIDNATNEEGYRIISSTGGNISGDLPADTTYWIETGLSANTSYYRYVQVFNSVGVVNSLPVVKYTFADVPANLTSSSQGATAINLSWSGNGTRYAIERSTNGVDWSYIIQWQDNLTLTTYQDTGLSIGTTYWYRVRAYNGDQIITSASNEISVKTLSAYLDVRGIKDLVVAGTPSDIIVEVVDENGNRVTDYTGTIRFTSDDTQAVLPDDYTFTSLDAGIHTFINGVTFNTIGEHYLSVTDIKDNRISGKQDNITVRDGTPPEPVADLIATLLEGAKIRLDWVKSVSEDADKYRIYYSTIPEIDYNEIKATVLHPTTTWTSPQLEVGKTYYFVVRTVDKSGNEEQNENIVSATVEESLTGLVKAVIKIPQNGKKVSGNRLMVMAEVVVGEISEVKNILFEYKKEDDTVWQTIPAANFNHPNPDSEYPYFIHWDVSSLAEGRYNIRAVATDIYDVSDSNPGYITIEIDHSNPDIEEKLNLVGEQERKEKIDNRRNNVIKVGDNKENTITQVIIPEGAISTETAKILVVVNPVNPPPPSKDINPIDEYREIKLEGAELTGEVSIIIPYKDEDDDGKVDGKGVPEDTLSAFYYDEDRGKWEKITTELDFENNIATVKTTHFTLFALFGVPANDYSNVRVYPNPFKPSKGHNYIKFDNLTANTKIQIFDLAGKLIWEKENIDVGEAAWNVVNQAGEEVASGVYICLFTNDLGERRIVKVVVIR